MRCPACCASVDGENAAPAGEVLRQAEGGNSAEAPDGAPVDVRLERMGCIFDQRNTVAAAPDTELDDAVGETVGVTCQNSGNARPSGVLDRLDAYVSVIERYRGHHRPEPGCEGAEEHGIVLERRHEDAISRREKHRNAR